VNGLLVIDKPAGITSHDVVGILRRITSERSIGHLGTLDPMATGVLPLLLGKFTRLAQYFSSAEKSYTGTIRFGFATDTYDAEGEPAGLDSQPSLTLDLVRETASRFHGEMEQMPELQPTSWRARASRWNSRRPKYVSPTLKSKRLKALRPDSQ
jgi:tRNA pseudouridine55 synthase